MLATSAVGGVLVLSVAVLGELGVVENHSFRSPFNQVNPFSGFRQINSWETGGSASIYHNFVRLTGEQQGQRGWLYNRAPHGLPEWSVVMEIRASGQSPQLYGDGMAFWFVKNPEHYEGAVFGREDKWTGLGIFFDTFQNLDHSHHHKHPYIYAMVNDGESHYIPDAEKSPEKHAVPGVEENSGCSYDFRFHDQRDDVDFRNITKVHITYTGKTLKLRLKQTGREWHNCIAMENVELPPGYFFGMSSATGDLVDNHDIVSFTMHSISGVGDAEKAYEQAEQLATQAREQEEMSSRPTPDNYLEVIMRQANKISHLEEEIRVLKRQMEYNFIAVHGGLGEHKKKTEAKEKDLKKFEQRLESTKKLEETLETKMAEVDKVVEEKVAPVVAQKDGWRMPFAMLFFIMLGVSGFGYNRYKKLMKAHIL